jgi:aspartate racemase
MMIKMKRLGIIGGLGPETSCKFLLSVNNRFRQLTKCQPDIILENLPISAKAEQQIIHGELGFEHLRLIEGAIKRLNKSEADIIVIPCNTVHVFIDRLRKLSKKPVLSIIEECGKECKRLNLSKVGLLGSTKTINEKLHFDELKNKGISAIFPEEIIQKRISEIIIKIVHNKTSKNDEKFLLKVISNFKKEGAEAVILACTDLPLLISPKNANLPLINTVEILANSSVENLKAGT